MLKTLCLDEDGNTLYHLTQWDENQKLVVEFDNYTFNNAPVVHFANKYASKSLQTNSIVLHGNTVTADIPNIFLTKATPLIAYICETRSNGYLKTIATIKIPVRKKIQQTDESEENLLYSDDIVIVYLDDKINEVNNVIDRFNDLDIDTKNTEIASTIQEYNSMKATLEEMKSYIGIIV